MKKVLVIGGEQLPDDEPIKTKIEYKINDVVVECIGFSRYLSEKEIDKIHKYLDKKYLANHLAKALNQY